MKPILNIATLAILFLSLFFASCDKNEISAPPTIKVLVNGDDVTAAPSVIVATGARVEYQFDITGSSIIDDVKTVFYDITNPAKKVSKQVLVAGQSNALTETVKGVLFVTSNTEIVLVVKDIDGNEVSKSITITIQ